MQFHFFSVLEQVCGCLFSYYPMACKIKCLHFLPILDIRYISILPVLTCFLLSSCQEDSDIIDPSELGKWKYYNRSNGLSDDCIYVIKQDREGNIWVGTDAGGVCMFDGDHWSHYTMDDGLLSNLIFAIEEDVDGDMWIATSAGLNLLIDGQLYYLDSIGEFPVTPIALFADSKDQMWIGTRGQGIFVVNRTQYNYAFLDNPDHGYVSYITEDQDNNIWFATRAGAFYFDGQNFLLYSNSTGLNDKEILYIMPDSWGDVWFSTLEDSCVFRYDGHTAEQISLSNGYTVSGVFSMVEDLNRNIWFSTCIAGIVKYNRAEMQSIKIADGLKDTIVYCSTMDREGNLWFGTDAGGINVYITK